MPVVAVVGAKGGVGTSLVAANLALVLARRVDCLLVDLDPDGGDDDLLLSLAPTPTWAGLIPIADEVSGDQLAHVVQRHPGGLGFLAAPIDAAGTPSGRIRLLLESLAGQVAWLLVDCSSRTPSLLREVYLAASYCLLVCTADPLCLRSLRRMTTGIPVRLEGRTGLAVNQVLPRVPVNSTEIGRGLGLPVLTVAPADPQLAGQHVHVGMPVVDSQDSRLAKAIVHLAQALLEAGPALEMPAGQGPLIRERA